MPKDEMPGHNCIRHLRSVVQQQQTKIAELEKTAAEHKHQLAEQVKIFVLYNAQHITAYHVNYGWGEATVKDSEWVY